MAENVVGNLLVNIGGKYTLDKNIQKGITDIQKLGTAVQAEGKKITDFSASWADATAELSKSISTPLAGVRNSILTVGQATAEYRGILDPTVDQVKALGKEVIGNTIKWQNLTKTLGQVSNQLWIVSMGMKQLGMALTVWGAPIIALGALSIKTFAEIDTAAAELAIALDVDKNAVAGLSDSFGELSQIMPVSRKEFLEIAKAAAEAGIAANQMETWAIAIGKAVTITKELKPEVLTEGIKKTMDAFGIAQGQVERTLSVVTKAAKDTVGGMKDYMNALVNVAPAAKVLNLSFSDTNALLMSLIPLQKSATRAGSRLNNIFIEMEMNLDVMAKQMGYSKDQLDEMISKDAIGVIKEYLDRLGMVGKKYEQIDAASAIFSKNTLRALLPLFDETGKITEQQKVLNEEWENAVTLNKDYAIASDTLANNFKIFRQVVSELAMTIGKDLYPILSKFLDKATAGMITVIAVWQNLPDWLKKIAIGLGGIVAILGPLILLLDQLFIAPIAGIVTFTSRLLNLADILRITGALIMGGKGGLAVLGIAFAKIALVVGGVIIALVALYAVLNHFFDLTAKIKKALGFEDLSKKVEQSKNRITSNLGEITKAAEETAEKTTEAFDGLAAKLGEWGDKIMEKFLYGFKEADFGILSDAMRIVSQYFEVLEAKGEMAAEDIYKNTVNTRRLIAKAIYELRELGKVSTEVSEELARQLGPERMEAIMKEMVAGVGVSGLEDVLEELQNQLKERTRALEKETEQIDLAIKEKEDIYGEQIDKEEDAVKLLEKRLKVLKKAYEQEVKPLEEAVEVAQDRVDDARDDLEDLRDLHDEELDTMQEEQDLVKDKIEINKEALQELKDLRDEEVDVAEGMLDYERMNLESARNALKAEQALGKDEWDAEFRTAEEREKLAREQVDLAYANYLRTKNVYKDEIDAVEDLIDLDEEELKALEKEYKTTKKIYDTEEEIIEDRLEIAEDQLKLSKRALDDFEDIYQDQKEVIQEEIDVRNDIISDYKESRDEILDSLKEERDLITSKANEEKDILQDRIDSAQDSLDAAKEFYQKQKNFNDLYLELEKERLEAFEEATGEGGTLGLPTEEEMANYVQAYKEALGIMDTDTKTTTEKMNDYWEDFKLNFSKPNLTAMQDNLTGALGDIWDWLVLEVGKINWGQIGTIILGLFFPPLLLLPLAKEYFKKEEWEGIKTWINSIIGDINWKDIGNTILGMLFPPFGLYQALTAAFDVDWDQTKKDIVGFVEGINWGEIGTAIFGAIFPIGGLFTALSSAFNINWGQVLADLIEFVGSINWSEIGNTILGALFSGPIAFANLGTQIYNSIVSGLEGLGLDLKGIGTWIAETIASGFDLAKDLFKNASNLVYSLAEGLNEKWEEIKGWGTSIMGNLAQGIWDGLQWVSDAFNAITTWPVDGIHWLVDSTKQWAKDMIGNFAQGIWDAQQWVSDAIWNMANWIHSVLGFSEPEFGPLKQMAIWGKHMIENYTRAIEQEIPNLEKVLGSINTLIGSDFNDGVASAITTLGNQVVAGPVMGTPAIQQAEPAIAGVANPTEQLAQAGAQPNQTGNTYNIQPGMMIASKGEVRSFVRMLDQYQKVENERSGD